VSRLRRQATDAGVITPRSAATVVPPKRYLTLARLIGAAGMVSLTVLLFWLLTDDSFRVTEARVSFEGLRYADEAAVRAHLSGLDRSPNVFRVRASEIVSELQDLPEVISAYAIVTLPADVSVHVQEREPIFIWSDGRQAWLVDREGMLFAPASFTSATAAVDGDDSASDDFEAAASESAAPEAAASGADPLFDAADSLLPTLDDWRLLDEPPNVGSHLPAADLAVTRQLLALTPELLGSRAEELWLRVDQLDGYVLHSDRGWQAIFGHYTPTLQPPEMVPHQVECLRWLLASEERQLERVRLAVSGDECGTFTRIG
jgi:hypothetical protein